MSDNEKPAGFVYFNDEQPDAKVESAISQYHIYLDVVRQINELAVSLQYNEITTELHRQVNQLDDKQVRAYVKRAEGIDV
jgi:glutathionylspermidine synthase